MQLKEPNNDPLEEAIATIVSEAPPQGLYTRCLDKARFWIYLGNQSRLRGWFVGRFGRKLLQRLLRSFWFQ